MHYPNSAFAMDRSEPTIVSKVNSELKFGQRVGFSTGDVKTINRLYGCPADQNSDELFPSLSDPQVKADLLAKENLQSEISQLESDF